MKKNLEYTVFILSYGRPGNVVTYDTLRNQGYTGKIYIVCSTDDVTLGEYEKKYQGQVLVFDKSEYFKKVDTGDNFPRKDTVLFARNAIFDIAEKIGIAHFVVFDDDYSAVLIRTPENGHLRGHYIKNLSRLFSTCFSVLEKMDIDCLSLAQGGDYIGGADCGWFTDRFIPRTRKSMNVYFQRTSRRYSFFGRMNDDVNTYVVNGTRGITLLTHPRAAINQAATQRAAGGLSEMYLDLGTYVKSFYSVMFAPSCVKIGVMGRYDMRLHHAVNWYATTPMIIRERYKKK